MSTTYSSLRRELTNVLSPVWANESVALVRALMCDVLDADFTRLMLMDQDVVPAHVEECLRGMAARLLNREPLQYVTGRAMFCDLVLHVAPGVLIPRPETEQLVEWVLAEVPREGVRIVDVGTGSGCIPLALKKSLGALASVSALDVSDVALDIARDNAARLSLDVRFMFCDVLKDDSLPGGPYDVVVSNPPYVRNCERQDMTPDVLLHEPALALFVPDHDPLLFYRNIAQKCAAGALAVGGRLYFEINEAFGRETVEMLQSLGFADVVLRQDFADRNRMVRAVWQP